MLRTPHGLPTLPVLEGIYRESEHLIARDIESNNRGNMYGAILFNPPFLTAQLRVYNLLHPALARANSCPEEGEWRC
jgi:hypothetical protein